MERSRLYDRGMVWNCWLHAHRSTWCWTAATSALECSTGLWRRTPEERRQVIAAIGPLWSWHEVWLVGFGGTVLAVFPKLLASAFAGYYLALFLILWCLILRGISLEVGGHINDRMWQGFWDFVFVVANTLLAILFGAAAGNMARGVPLASDGTFSMAFFTDFTPRGYVGLLDWYTVSIAIFAAVMLSGARRDLPHAQDGRTGA